MVRDSTFRQPRGRSPECFAQVTAIVYLVADDWDAAPDKDGGQLVWWNIERGDPDAGGVAKKSTLNPTAGQLCVFKARTIMHEVLPTHRKRFAVTLWYYLKPAAAAAGVAG